MKRLLCILFLLPFFGIGQIIFDTNFETVADLDGTSDAWRADIPGNGSTYTLVTGAREGTYCLRMPINAGNIRNEIVKQNIFDWGVEYWVGYALKVEEPVSGYHIITQHRPLPSGPNSFTIQTANTSTLTFSTSTNDAYAFSTPGTSAEWNTEKTNKGYALDAWIDVVVHFKLATTGGIYKIWVNGDVILDISEGTTVYSKDLSGATKDPLDYAKIGLYYGDNRTSGIVYFDAYRVWEGPGGTYEDVSPLGLSESGEVVTPPTPPTPGIKRKNRRNQQSTTF